MQRDMKRCQDVNPCVDVSSENAKGYITQRIVIATQRIGIASQWKDIRLDEKTLQLDEKILRTLREDQPLTIV